MITDDILIRYIQHTCSAEEIELVHEWLASDVDHHRLFELEELYGMNDYLYYQNNTVCESAYQRLQASLTQSPKSSTQNRTSFRISRFRLHSWRRYAAAILLVGLLSTNLIYLLQHNKRNLSLSYNTISVPLGERASDILSDGTRVWLNAGTEFSYPSTFDSDTRHVSLLGEGYFEVTPNKDKPFIVALNKLNIRVLGTKFNAKSYKGEAQSVTLCEGAVEVTTRNGDQKKYMEPKDQVFLSEKGILRLVKNNQLPNVNDWKDGSLRIDNQLLGDFIHDMERHFNTQIYISDDSLRDLRFTCHFKNDIGVREAMELLKATRQIDYVIKEKKIIINKYK